MTGARAVCISTLIVWLLSGCSSSLPPGTMTQDAPANPRVSLSTPDDLLPLKATGKITDQYIRSGVACLRAGDYTNASREFNRALRFEPQNSYLHFLNGFVYQLMADAGNSEQYESAKVGYELALKCDPNNWLASQQLGWYFLKVKDPSRAQGQFASALLYHPDDPELLYGLAQASYFTHDLPTAYAAISRARGFRPDSPEIVGASAMIAAAMGQPDSAQKILTDFRRLEPNTIRYARLESRLADWKAAYASDENRSPIAASLNVESAPVQDSPAIRNDGAEKVPDGGRMAVIDVVMIRTEEYESSGKGVNLLDGVAKADDGGSNFLDGLFVKFTGSITNNGERTVTSTISLPEIRYNLNIFNAGSSRSEILARPTLIALDNQTSEFFGGDNLYVAVNGLQSGDLKEIEAGVRLKVLPTFLTDDIVKLTVEAKRAFVEGGNVGSFQQGVSTSKNEVTATVMLRLGQTLILSGMREKQKSEIKSGVPILEDIPLLQYLFSTEKTLDLHRSILILLTPRRVTPGMYISPGGNEHAMPETTARGNASSVTEFRRRYGYLFSQDDNIVHIMRHLDKHAVMTEFRQSDFFDNPWWGSADSIDIILRRALGFLYY